MGNELTADSPRRRVVLLGATGSIGRQACDVIERFPERFELVGVVAGRDGAALAEVVRRFEPQRFAVLAPDRGTAMPPGCATGIDAVCDVAAMDAEVVCVAIPGAAALQPTLAAIDAGRDIATATKEVLVMAGELVCARAAASGARLLPVDSEHPALWQCLRGEDPASVRRVVLTASGGPFLERPLPTFSSITPDEALAHPTWRMGRKVTLDSATMMNKGLEIIEAHFLFDMPYERIDVAVHPTSLLHSYVEFRDGAIVAQLGAPDMRVPIAFALSGGHRLEGAGRALDLRQSPALQFHPVDAKRFPAVNLARLAGETGGVAPAVLNAANEVAVDGFLAGACGYTHIVGLVGDVVEHAERLDQPSLDAILAADAWARDRVAARLQRETALP
ncbi:MAG: 1-deoxy-D-xylulose-5-phosphate reductoisomerase [Candidatus Dormibacteria bacterium]